MVRVHHSQKEYAGQKEGSECQSIERKRFRVTVHVPRIMDTRNVAASIVKSMRCTISGSLLSLPMGSAC